MEQSNLLEMQRLAETEHQKFVDFMHPLYGLESHPGYCPVKIKHMLLADSCLNGGDYEIYINPSENLGEISYTTWHESSHYLHYSINPSELNNQNGNNIILKETLADLGALVYLENLENLDAQTIKRFYPEFCKDNLFNVALNLAKKRKDLIKKLARQGYRQLLKE